MTRILLIRHGQTEWNRNERFRGRADVPLNETGLIQARMVGKRVAALWKPEAIYSSPLSRAVKTAETIAKHFDLNVRLHFGLIDIDYGQWEGLSPREVQKKWPQIIESWYDMPEVAHIPGGETLAEVRGRAMAALKDLIGCHEGQTIVIVSHTVINRVILLGVLGLGNDSFWRLQQDTCAINCFGVEGGNFTLFSLNDTCHLNSEI